MSKVTEIVVKDGTPVSGEGMAIQSYLDLSLSKEDLVDAIISEKETPLEEELATLEEKISEIRRERSEITEESRAWSESLLVKAKKKEIEILSKMFKTSGSFERQYFHIFDTKYYNYTSIKFSSEDGYAGVIHKVENKLDIPHYKRLEALRDEERKLEREVGRVRDKLHKIPVEGKRLRANIARQILSQTEQGRALNDAMSLQRIVNKSNKALGVSKKVTKKKAKK